MKYLFTYIETSWENECIGFTENALEGVPEDEGKGMGFLSQLPGTDRSKAV
jgi:hypothetical protein